MLLVANEMPWYRNLKFQSVLDPVRYTLCPDVFSGERLRARVRRLIMDGVRRIADNFPIKVNGAVIVGSITTFQYRDDSDIDVNVMISGVDQKFVRDKLNPYIGSINEQVFIEKHPINYKVILGDYDFRKTEGAYNVLKDEWMKKATKSRTDISQTLNSPTVQIPFEDLRGRIEQLHEDLIDLCEGKGSLREVNEALGAIEQEYHNVADARRNYYDAHPESANISALNVLYKLIEESGYLKLCKALLHAVGEGNKVRTQQQLREVQEAFNRTMGQNPVPECAGKLKD